MIRPAERFAVNIAHDEPGLTLSRRSPWTSLPTMIALGAVLGAGIGGILPSSWGPVASPPPVAVAASSAGSGLAAIEPAAGPTGAMTVPRAPDERFYAPVLLDSIPITMQLEPTTPGTRLSPSDARRLAIGGAAGSVVHVGELRLGATQIGPVALPVGSPDAATSILGAELLDRLAVVSVDGESLRLAPR